MSQYTFLCKDGEVVTGYDHAIGYFCDLYRDGEDEPFLEESSAFTGLTGVGLVQLFDDYDVDVPSDIIANLMLDLPF